jgi:hypothetical protein
MRKSLLAAAVLLLAAAAFADQQDSSATDGRSLFARGRTELLVGGGYGVFNSKDYLILLLGGNYYLEDGLSAGLSGEAWLGSSPQLYDFSPQLRDILLDVPWKYKPYVGAFYRRTVYNRLYKPLDSAGGRAGLVFPLNERAYLTAGVAFEHYFNCDKSVYSSCDDAYPEVGLAFSF